MLRHELVPGQGSTQLGRASSSLVLRSLDSPERFVRSDIFPAANIALGGSGEAYEHLLEVKGPWVSSPTHAVFAEWQIIDLSKAMAFEESRRQLFELRRQVLPTFALDWLLGHLGNPRRYLVLGLYGDKEGATRLCREHPMIRQFAATRPPANYTASDLTGLRWFRIEQLPSLFTR